MKKKLLIVLAVVLTLTLLLTSFAFAGGGKNGVVPAQMVLDASLSEVSTTFNTPKADLEVARSRAFSFGDDKYLLSSIVDKKSNQAYMVSTDAQGKVWIAKPKIEDELIDHTSQMKPDETVIVSIWAIYVSPEEELWQIPSKYPDVPFEGNRPALEADVSPEVLAAIDADITEIKLRAHEEAVQPVVDFLQSTGSTILYVSQLAPVVGAELSKNDVYKLARLPEVKRISLPDELEPCMDTAARTIEADDVWAEGYDGGGTDGSFGESKYYPYWFQTQVAVIDTGIDFSHSALAHANGGSNGLEISGPHGTQVAGCIASIPDPQDPPPDNNIRGIAYGTELLDAQASYSPNELYLDDVIDACDWAHIENYADIYNMSSGTSIFEGNWDNDWCEFSDHIVSQWNRLVVCAAGNINEYTGYSDIVVSPANAFNVLAVGGIDDKNTEDWNDDEFWQELNPGGGVIGGSCWGNPNDGREKPEVCAPADEIITTDLGGGFTDENPHSGTSYAAPQVTGIAAQLMEQDPSLVYAPELTKAIIMATAIHNVVGDPRMDDQEGVGTVDAYAAYQCVKEGDYTLQWRPNDEDFYIAEFYADKGETVRFVINWLVPTDYYGSGDYGLYYSNFDLFIKDQNGNTHASSTSAKNPWEIVQFIAPSSGTYKAWVDTQSLYGDYTWVAAAWYRGSFPVAEDFEWGNDGQTLDINPPPGDVDWTVSAPGSSYAQIYEALHHSGTRSAKFYRNGSNNVHAYFSCFQPDSIRFYIVKYLSSDANICIGNGEYRLRVKVTTFNRIQYCDDSCHNTAEYMASPTAWGVPWHLLELKNINWVAGTYDIHITTYFWGQSYYRLVKSGATMQHPTAADSGRLRFSSEEGTGKFVIDDILVD